MRAGKGARARSEVNICLRIEYAAWPTHPFSPFRNPLTTSLTPRFTCPLDLLAFLIVLKSFLVVLRSARGSAAMAGDAEGRASV